MKTLVSRRRLLLGAASLAAFPVAAYAQQVYPPRAPYGQPLPPPAGAQQNPYQGVPEAQPQAGGGGHTSYGHGPIEPPDGQQWYIGEVPDPPFVIKKVNQDLLDPAFRRQLVNYSHSEQPGSLIIDPRQHFLYLLREGNTAVRYGVGVGREGFGWNGAAMVGRIAKWPDWVPPKEMRLRQPELPERMAGGPDNPLGARALYLYQGNKDTLYRIHGTAEPWTIGTNVSSGCIRLLNEEIADLYLRTPVNTRVVVL